MRFFLIVVFVANLVATLMSLALLPEKVAIHFNLCGVADGWGSSYVLASIMTIAQTVAFMVVFFIWQIIALYGAFRAPLQGVEK